MIARPKLEGKLSDLERFSTGNLIPEELLIEILL